MALVPNHKRILVVDDNKDSANSLAVLIQLMGHEAAAAFDGPTALAIATDFKPDLVLLDLTMPGMDGFAVARELRSRQGNAALSIIALTGFGQSDFLRATKEAGFDSHLTKPAPPAELTKLLGSGA